MGAGVIMQSISSEAIKLLKSEEKTTILGPANNFLIFPFLFRFIACCKVETPANTITIGATSFTKYGL